MNLLPPELIKIVYKYIYDCVIKEVRSSYGNVSMLKLVVVPDLYLCDRIKKDTSISICKRRVWEHLVAHKEFDSYFIYRDYAMLTYFEVHGIRFQ